MFCSAILLIYAHFVHSVNSCIIYQLVLYCTFILFYISTIMYQIRVQALIENSYFANQRPCNFIYMLVIYFLYQSYVKLLNIFIHSTNSYHNSSQKVQPKSKIKGLTLRTLRSCFHSESVHCPTLSCNCCTMSSISLYLSKCPLCY